jgi:hypothetical protein
MPLQELIEDPTLRGAPTNSRAIWMLSETAAAAFYPELFTLPRNGSERNSGSLLLFLLHGTEFRAVFSSTERFGREFREFALPRNDSERNSESLLLFLLHGTEFWVVFSSAEGFGMEFRGFASIFGLRDGIPSCFLFRGRVRNGIPRISVPRNSRNSVGNNHLFRQFRLPRNYFLSEIPNPSLDQEEQLASIKYPDRK